MKQEEPTNTTHSLVITCSENCLSIYATVVVVVDVAVDVMSCVSVPSRGVSLKQIEIFTLSLRWSSEWRQRASGWLPGRAKAGTMRASGRANSAPTQKLLNSAEF